MHRPQIDIGPDPSRMRACFVAFFAVLGCAACASSPDGPPVVPVTSERVEKPAWAREGTHPDFPASTHYFIMLSSASPAAPHEVALRRALSAGIQKDIAASLDGKLDAALAQACASGRWAGRMHIPDGALVTESFSDGFESAAFAAVERAAVRQHNRQRLATEPGALDADPVLPAETGEARKDFHARALLFWRAAEDLATRALAGAEPADGHIARASRALSLLLEFREQLVVRLTGANGRLMLGETPKGRAELSLYYRGWPAAALPLRAQTGLLPLLASRQTDERGTGYLSFTSAITYTGLAENHVGFALDPDLLLPDAALGVEFAPWLGEGAFATPDASNTVIYLNLTEKLEGKTIKGPVGIALKEMIGMAGLPVIEIRPAPNEQRFVLEIQGVLSCNELIDAKTGSRQIRAKGSIVLRGYAGHGLASIPLAGNEAVGDPGAEKAANAALDKGWNDVRATVIAKFREAFPPIFRADAR